MNAAPDNDAPQPRSRGRVELIVASSALAFGLFVLPGLIYAVGGALLGPYGENQGLGSFYADFFRDLAEPSGRAWSLALGPLVLLTVIRAVFIGVKGPPGEPLEQTPPAEPPPRRRADEPHRVEPRVTLD